METQIKKQKFFIKITIVKTEVCQENKFPYKSYIVYSIQVNTNHKTWLIKRRYKNFYELHQKLKKSILNMPKLPPKLIFMSDKSTKDREIRLQKYINILLLREDVYKYNDIFDFVEMEKEYFLIIKENLTDVLDAHINKFREHSLIKNSKSSDVVIEENFFYPKFIFDNSNLHNTHDVKTKFSDFFYEKTLRDFIHDFLKQLNEKIEDRCKIIKDFNKILKERKPYHQLQREEVYRLLFGEKGESIYLKGILYHSGTIKENQLGAECCLEFLANLIDYEFNVDCDFFINILKLCKLTQISEIMLDEHLKSKKKHVISASYIILKNVINEEKGITASFIIKNEDLVDKFEAWLLSNS